MAVNKKFISPLFTFMKASWLIKRSTRLMSRTRPIIFQVSEPQKKGRFVIEITIALANTIAVLILVWANCQTREQIGIQREQLKLQRKSIENIDSTLYMMHEQILAQQEANSLQRGFNMLSQENLNVTSSKFVEENKPIINLSKIDCRTENNVKKIFFNYENIGKSIASNVRADIFIKDFTTLILLSTEIDSYRSITPDKIQVSPRNVPKWDIYVLVKLTWQWEYNKKGYAANFSKTVISGPITDSCSCYTIMADESEIIWREQLTPSEPNK